MYRTEKIQYSAFTIRIWEKSGVFNRLVGYFDISQMTRWYCSCYLPDSISVEKIDAVAEEAHGLEYMKICALCWFCAL